jgi:lipoyl-dependent peroxiredoxin
MLGRPAMVGPSEGAMAMAMAERTAEVTWEGDLLKGNGRLTLASSGILRETGVSWPARTEQAGGKTSPEELLAAAHASCYAMAFSATLARRGTPPTRLDVTATCLLDRKEGGGVQVTTMNLRVRGQVPGLDQAGFEAAAREGEQGCPISNAIRNNVQINLTAELQS